ncbi:MAG: hypothetical protein LBS92_07500 [Candidatus Methanoplasma sp.]|jgi:hypothetical protein|nr:hypothetical protein [Candidatus Methanoplasma sp.]
MGILNSIKDGINGVADSTSDAVSNVGVNSKINDKKRDVEKKQREIGEIVYRLASSDGSFDIGEDVKKLCEEISRLYDGIDELEKQKKK